VYVGGGRFRTGSSPPTGVAKTAIVLTQSVNQAVQVGRQALWMGRQFILMRSLVEEKRGANRGG
jgi:hypothetical protein